MTDRDILARKILFAVPSYTFAETTTGIKFIAEIDLINEHIYWCVCECDHITEFDNCSEAIDYYLSIGGTV